MERGPLLFAWHWGALPGQWLGAGQKIAELGWSVPFWSGRGQRRALVLRGPIKISTQFGLKRITAWGLVAKPCPWLDSDNPADVMGGNVASTGHF